MKRTINGITCDTVAATEIIAEGHGCSLAWWGLYQTPGGSFFKVVVGTDGKVAEWALVAAEQTKKMVEKYAPHMIEKVFGSAASASDAALSELRITVQVPVGLAQRIETVAADQGISVDNYVVHSIEKTLAQEPANFC